MSRFKKAGDGRFVIIDVTFRLRPGPPTATYPDIVDYLAGAVYRRPTFKTYEMRSSPFAGAKGMVLDQSDPEPQRRILLHESRCSGHDRDRVAMAAERNRLPFRADGGAVKLSAAWLIERAALHAGTPMGALGFHQTYAGRDQPRWRDGT
jgi:hypothetical protein